MTLDDILNVNENEKPLDRLAPSGGFTSILRKVACIGDSLASGECESLDEDGNEGYHDFYDISWGQYMARLCGIEVQNFSCGGLMAKSFCLDLAPKWDLWDPSKAANAYIIALGVNDLIYNTYPVGSLSDIDPDDPEKNRETFTGYCAKIIQKYKKIQPYAKFFLVTIPRGVYEVQTGAERQRDVMYELAGYFDRTYVIDLRKYGPEYDEGFMKKYFVGSHMNSAGYYLSALMISSYIDYIIRHNPDDFRLTGFIGTGLGYKGVEN